MNDCGCNPPADPEVPTPEICNPVTYDDPALVFLSHGFVTVSFTAVHPRVGRKKRRARAAPSRSGGPASRQLRFVTRSSQTAALQLFFDAAAFFGAAAFFAGAAAFFVEPEPAFFSVDFFAPALRFSSERYMSYRRGTG